MKQPLEINPLYYAPYIIHDVVTVYDKSIGQYVDRHRTVGISFNRLKKIVIASTICSNLDSFDKKKGTNIVRSRINTALKTHFRRAKNVLSFDSIKDFNSFCDRFDDISKLLFVPYEVTQQGEDSIHKVRLVDPKCRNTDVKDPSEIYLNKTYINDLYTRFFYAQEPKQQVQQVNEPTTCEPYGTASECSDAD